MYIILVFTILLSGCPSSQTINQNTIKEDQIVREYRIHYDKNLQELRASAQFRLASYQGESIALNHPSYITVDNEELLLRHGDNAWQFNGSTYNYKFETASPKSYYQFMWQRMDTKQIIDQVAILPGLAFREIQNHSITLSRSKDLNLTINGDFTDINLEVSISFPNSNHDILERIEAEKFYSNSQTFFTISKENMKSLWLGEADLKLSYSSHQTVYGLKEEFPLKTIRSRNETISVEIVE